MEIRSRGNTGENIVKTWFATGDMADICLYNSGSLFQALNSSEFFVDLTNEPFMVRVDEMYKNSVARRCVVQLIARTIISRFPLGTFNESVEKIVFLPLNP